MINIPLIFIIDAHCYPKVGLYIILASWIILKMRVQIKNNAACTDEDRDGATAGVRRVLLCVLRGEPKLSAVRLHHPRPPRHYPHRPGGHGDHPSLPSPHFYRLRFFISSYVIWSWLQRMKERNQESGLLRGVSAGAAIDHLRSADWSSQFQITFSLQILFIISSEG